jgi:hypothetical protein
MKRFSPPVIDRNFRSPALPSAKLNDAVHRVIEECCSSARPFLCLGNFVRRLTDDSDWSRAEIIEVQTKALRMLKQMIYSDDADSAYRQDDFDPRRTQRWNPRDLQARS